MNVTRSLTLNDSQVSLHTCNCTRLATAEAYIYRCHTHRASTRAMRETSGGTNTKPGQKPYIKTPINIDATEERSRIIDAAIYCKLMLI